MERLLRRAASATAIAAFAGGVCAAGVSAASKPPPRAQLRQFICQTGMDPATRAVSVAAVMRPLAGTRRMALRFQLLSSPRVGVAFRPISGGDLGRWISPARLTIGERPGDVWILNKQVVDLSAPARYRFRVQFRWTGAHHRVIRVSSRTTGICRQPELRPDLTVRRVTVNATARAGVYAYDAVVANRGVSAAGPFEVWFAPGGAANQSRMVAGGLAPHSVTTVRFLGGTCRSATPPVVTADPIGDIDDFDRTNNRLTVVCPAASPPA
jgi:CARDB